MKEKAKKKLLLNKKKVTKNLERILKMIKRYNNKIIQKTRDKTRNNKKMTLEIGQPALSKGNIHCKLKDNKNYIHKSNRKMII